MKIEHTYSGRIAETRYEMNQYIIELGHLTVSRDMEEHKQRLAEAIAHRDRALANFPHFNRKANLLLKMALEESGLSRYKGKWTLEVSTKMSLFPLSSDGTMHFALKGFRWKGDPRRCPLMRIMPLSFPVSWLDLPARKVRAEMAALA